MNLFDIDYTQATAKLLKEAFAFKKYKAMHPALAVFTAIFTCLYMVAGLVAAACTYALGIIFNFIKAPIVSLQAIVNREGKEVNSPAQFIIYFISWPVVFGLYAVASVMLIPLSILYFATVVLSYIWTLGGFKFHFYANAVDSCSITVSGRYHVALPMTYVITNAVAFVLFWIIAPILETMLYDEAFSDLFPQFLGDPVIYMYWYVPFLAIFSVLYSLIALAPRPKAK